MRTTSMSTKSHSSPLGVALAAVSNAFRPRLIQNYLELKTNWAQSRYDACGLSAGKFCEVVLRLLQQKVHGTFTPFNSKVGNFHDECRRLVQAPAAAANESERTVLPRALAFLYTMRNKRGIGHIGGDVDANAIDTAAMAKIADWVVCELIRINHSLSLEEAQELVDGISFRELPTIWEIAGKKRVLKEGLKAREEVLLLLYSSAESAVPLEDLCEWVEYSNPSVFKSKVIAAMHKKRLIEHDTESDCVILSPKGIAFVEKNLT